MTTFNTGNPIGSTDARDRSDNSENLDLAVNSLSQTFADRLGVTRDTLEGIYQKSAYYRAGTFDAGYTLTNNRQTLAYGNVEYSWSGAFPKVVTTGATPTTSGGIGAGAWVDRTQDTLRSEVVVAGALTIRDEVYNSGVLKPKRLSSYGIPSGGDDHAALQAIMDAAGHIIVDTGSDILVSDWIKISSNTILEWEGKGFLKLTQSSYIGGVLFAAGSNNTASENILVLNPHVDANNFGYPTGAAYGENGVGGTNVKNMHIIGGHIKNCRDGTSGPFTSGGKAIQFENGSENCTAHGQFVENCTCVIGTGGVIDDVSGDIFRRQNLVTYSDIRAMNCERLIFVTQTFSPPSDLPIAINVTIERIQGRNIGREVPAGTETTQGIILIDRGANVAIRGVSVHNDTSYGTVPCLIRHRRGYKCIIEDIDFTGDCTDLISHVGTTGWGTTGVLQDNIYRNIRHFGTAGHLIVGVTGDSANILQNYYEIFADAVSSGLIDSTMQLATSFGIFVKGDKQCRLEGSLLNIAGLSSNTFPTASLAFAGTVVVGGVTMSFGSGKHIIISPDDLEFQANGTVRLKLTPTTMVASLPGPYADNAAAVTAGVVQHGFYYTATGVVMKRL